jgi:hypothetical protein
VVSIVRFSCGFAIVAVASVACFVIALALIP